MHCAAPVPIILYLPLALAAILCAMPAPARAGALKDIEDQAAPPPRAPARGEPVARRAGRADEDDSDSDQSSSDAQATGPDSLWWGFVRFSLLLPWALPRLLVDEPCTAGFAAYPYADGRGNVRHDPRRGGCALAPVEPVARRRWAVQTDAEGSYALAGLAGAALGARMQLPHRLEFAGRVSFLRDLHAQPREQALHGTVDMLVRFAQSPRLELRTGAGVRAFALDRRLYGFDFVYAMDVFGKRPIVSRLELHIGTLGHAAAGEARLTLGYMLGAIELYAGYDHTAFWSEAGTTRVSGPIAGLRAWF